MVPSRYTSDEKDRETLLGQDSGTKRPSRVIIDMDAGIDDALALIIALKSPEIEVAGITAVSGNVEVEKAAMNALRIVELLDEPDVWVAKGKTRPLAREPIRAYSFHGRDGLGDSNLPSPRIQLSEKDALNSINDTLESAKKREITMICTGPLTNLASLLTEFPDTKTVVNEIVIMGGAYGVTRYGFGNETPVAEFNIFSDPEAAEIVFESGVKLKAVGLDVTTTPHLELTRTDYARIRNRGTRTAGFAERILENNMQRHGRFTLHDPMAVATNIRPAYYKYRDYRVQVETRGEFTVGMTIADRRNWLPDKQLSGSPVSVCTSVDARFKRLFLQRLLAT